MFWKRLRLSFVSVLFFTNTWAQSTTNSPIAPQESKTKTNTQNKVLEKDIQEIHIIPRIKITERNSLKSYSWWEEKKPRVPKAYKVILKKIKDDFLLENYQVNYVLKPLSKNTLDLYNGHYVIYGNLILDNKNANVHELTDMSIYKIHNGSMDLVLISNVASQDIHSSFRIFATQLRDKKHNNDIVSPTQQSAYLDVNAKAKYHVVFENELTYEELKQIQNTIAENLKINLENIKLLYSENNKYTFELNVSKNPFKDLKNLVYINGPYQSEIKDHSLIFKSLVEHETNEENLDSQDIQEEEL